MNRPVVVRFELQSRDKEVDSKYHTKRRMEEAAEPSTDAQWSLETVRRILLSSLEADSKLDWEQLKLRGEFPKTTSRDAQD